MSKKPMGNGAGRPPVDYPTRCPRCRRNIRAPYETVDEKPNTIRAADLTGICVTCKRGGANAGRALSIKLSPEQQAERDRRTKEELEAFIADRRRRGVNPEGVRFPGDPPPIKSAEEIAGTETHCAKGHEYQTPYVPGRKRMCDICRKAREARRAQQRRARRRESRLFRYQRESYQKERKSA